MCRERALFRAALDCKIIRMLPLRHDERHDLRRYGDRDEDSLLITFDEFTCYADLWAEAKTDLPTIWANIETPWLSPLVRLFGLQ